MAQVLALGEPDNVGKEVLFKNCAPFADCISEINNTQIDNAKDIDVVMPIYNLIEYSDNYSKTSGSLSQYYRDEPALTDTGAIKNFHVDDNNSASFKFNQKITGVTAAGGIKDVEVMVPLKYLSNFWRTLEIPLINCEINLILNWSKKCVLSDDTKETTLAITDTKLYVPVQQLKSGFKRTINWNNYQSRVTIQEPNPYLDFLIDPSFQGVNRLFVLSFENKDDRTVHTKYYLPAAEIKDYNVMIDGQNLFAQPVKNDVRTFDNIRKIAIGQGDDYTTRYLLDYNYFIDYYKMIAIDLSKQQALDIDPTAIQQINFTRNLNRSEDVNDNTTMFFISEEAKETIIDFSQGTKKVS